MSQLDISIFYSHLFGLLLILYIFSHFIINILINYYYNNKLRSNDNITKLEFYELNKINTLMKILE